jgi:hypothetical protein
MCPNLLYFAVFRVSHSAKCLLVTIVYRSMPQRWLIQILLPQASEFTIADFSENARGIAYFWCMITATAQTGIGHGRRGYPTNNAPSELPLIAPMYKK